ncbi:MAG: aldo/keto reductase, partial [Candidatus Acidiferrales bacterium]
ARALGRSDARGFARFVSVQPRYNLLFREFERELFPLCVEEGIGVIPFNPIAGGLLAAKYDRTKPPSEGTRFAYGGRVGSLYRDRYWQDKLFDAVDALDAFAKEVGIPLTTLSVAWVLAQPWVTSPIIGASRAEQLDATIAALDVTLEPAVLAKLGEMTMQFR